MCCHALLQESFPNPGIEPTSLTSPALAGGSLPLVPSGKPIVDSYSFVVQSEVRKVDYCWGFLEGGGLHGLKDLGFQGSDPGPGSAGAKP